MQAAPPTPSSVAAKPTVFSGENATGEDAVPQTLEAEEAAADGSAGAGAAAKNEERRVVDMDYEMPDEEAW